MANTRGSYEVYLELSKNPVARPMFLELVHGFFKYIMLMIFQGWEVKFPAGCGTMFIRGRKQKPRIVDGKIKGLAPDWVGTKKFWDSNPEAKANKTLLYHTNEHTNGIKYGFKWRTIDINAENISFYSFKACRVNKRAVHQLILAGREYIVENK